LIFTHQCVKDPSFVGLGVLDPQDGGRILLNSGGRCLPVGVIVSWKSSVCK